MKFKYEFKMMICFMAIMAIYFFIASLAIDYNFLGTYLIIVISSLIIFSKKIIRKLKEIKLKIKAENIN